VRRYPIGGVFIGSGTAQRALAVEGTQRRLQLKAIPHEIRGSAAVEKLNQVPARRSTQPASLKTAFVYLIVVVLSVVVLILMSMVQ
jgi:hypothetical protein